MDDRYRDTAYRDGFERLLSDMDTAPSWRQVSTQRVSPTPTPAGSRVRNRGLLVAVAAFVVTIVAVGAVVFAGGGAPAPVAASTVEYVKIAWSQDVERRCVDMEIVDTGGFDRATIEIWGPNIEGLVRVDITAPDGSTDRFIGEHTPADPSESRIWHMFAGPGAERDIDYAFRSTECADETAAGTESYGMGHPPFANAWTTFAVYHALPTSNAVGGPLDYVADLADGVFDDGRSDEWRGAPVTVFMATNIDHDPGIGSIKTEVELWIDVAAGRYERVAQYHNLERVGAWSRIIEVTERGAVPENSVSFSIEGMTLTTPRSRVVIVTDDPADTTTTTPSPEAPFEDLRVSNAATVWINQLGLVQDDPREWRIRLGMICDVGYNPTPSDTPMLDLASAFIDVDTELSVREDGSLPSPEEAAESLWMIVADPRSCPERFTEPAMDLGEVDVAALETAEEALGRLIGVRNSAAIAADTRLQDMIIEMNEVIRLSDEISDAEARRRQAIINSARQNREAELGAVAALQELVHQLGVRYRELLGDTEIAPPVITLGGARTMYTQTGAVSLAGWVDQPVVVTIDGNAVRVYADGSGTSSFPADLDLAPGTHTITITATNDAGKSSTAEITVIVDPNLEVTFGFISGISQESDGTWTLVFDRAEFLDGEEARVAAIADGEIPEGGDLPNNFYIRNLDAKTSRISLGSDAIVTLQAYWSGYGSGIIEVAVDLSILATLLADPESAVDQLDWHWLGGSPSMAWLTLDDGVVLQIAEQYIP